MKDKVIQVVMVLALVGLVMGGIARLSNRSILFSGRAWHMFSQTSLLFGIAWGIGRLEAKGTGAL